MFSNPPINNLSYGKRSEQHIPNDFGSTAFKILVWALFSKRNTQKLD